MEEEKSLNNKKRAPNPDNLIPLNRRSKSEQRAIQKKGGIASGEKRRQLKSFKELLKVALATTSEDTGNSHAEDIVSALIRQAKTGDVRAFVEIRDTIGEKPKQEVDQTFAGGVKFEWGGKEGDESDND